MCSTELFLSFKFVYKYKNRIVLQGLVGKIKLYFNINYPPQCILYVVYTYCIWGGRVVLHTCIYMYNYSYRLLQLIIIVLKEMF